MKISVAINGYLEYRGEVVQPNTVRQDGLYLYAFLEHIGDRELGEIKKFHMQAYLARLREKGNENSYINKIRDRISAWLVFCAEKKWGADPLVLKSSWPRLGEVKHKKTYIPEEEWDALLDEADVDAAGYPQPRNRAALAILLYAGVRMSDVQAMKVSDLEIDPETGTGTMRYENVKSRRWETKAMRRELVREMMKWLRIYRGYCRAYDDATFQGFHLIPSGSRGPGGTYDPQKPYKRLGDTMGAVYKRHGINGRRLGAHTARRSSATAMYRRAIAAGVPDPIGLVSTHLNHSDRRVTDQYLDQLVDQERYERFVLDEYGSEPAAPAPAGVSMGRVIPIDRGVRRAHSEAGSAAGAVQDRVRSNEVVRGGRGVRPVRALVPGQAR